MKSRLDLKPGDKTLTILPPIHALFSLKLAEELLRMTPDLDSCLGADMLCKKKKCAENYSGEALQTLNLLKKLM